MTPELQHALVSEAKKFGAVDDDVIRLFPALTESLKPEDSNAIAHAVREMVAQKPRLFTVKPWQQMDPNSDEWREHEQRFRAALRRSRPITNEFSAVDAARCSEEELTALGHAVGGCASPWERGILSRALARQRQEDKAVGGDAA